MITFISLLTALLFAGLSFVFPRFMGWLFLAVMPIGSGFIGLTIIPSSVIPFRITQAGFFVALGILLSKNNWQLFISFSLRSRVAQFLLLFIVLSFCTALQNSDAVFWKHFLFYYTPSLISPLIVGFLTIRNNHDFKNLIIIFVWSSAIIGLLCVYEYFTTFNINNALYMATSPTVNVDEMQTARFRSGFLRVVGTEGDPVTTGIKLALLFPFTIWYLSKNKLIGWLPCILTIIGIFLCQSRAVFICLILSALFIMTKSIFITKQILLMSFIALLIFINVPEVNNFVSSFISERFISETLVPVMANEYVDERSVSIPLSFDYIFDSPIFGHGSSIYAYRVLMDYGDLPAPLLYLVSGGLLLGLSYISFLFGMVTSVLRKISKIIDNDLRNLLLFFTFALLNGVLPVFFNPIEKHFYIMIMAYAAFFKVYIYNERLGLINESIPAKYSVIKAAHPIA
jgi:hypothetical protein